MIYIINKILRVYCVRESKHYCSFIHSLEDISLSTENNSEKYIFAFNFFFKLLNIYYLKSLMFLHIDNFIAKFIYKYTRQRKDATIQAFNYSAKEFFSNPLWSKRTNLSSLPKIWFWNKKGSWKNIPTSAASMSQ